MNTFFKKIVSVLTVFSVFYFANHLVQTQLGKEVRKQLPLDIHSLDAGLEKAKKDNMLVLADYSAVWCPSCRKLDKHVFSNDTVAGTISAHFIFVKIEHDSEIGRQFAKDHNLSGFPRLLVLNIHGDRLSELPLTFDPTLYNANLLKVLETFSAE